MPGEGEEDTQKIESKPITETINEYATSAKESFQDAGTFVAEKLFDAKESIMATMEGAKELIEKIALQAKEASEKDEDELKKGEWKEAQEKSQETKDRDFDIHIEKRREVRDKDIDDFFEGRENEKDQAKDSRVKEQSRESRQRDQDLLGLAEEKNEFMVEHEQLVERAEQFEKDGEYGLDLTDKDRENLKEDKQKFWQEKEDLNKQIIERGRKVKDKTDQKLVEGKVKTKEDLGDWVKDSKDKSKDKVRKVKDKSQEKSTEGHIKARDTHKEHGHKHQDWNKETVPKVHPGEQLVDGKYLMEENLENIGENVEGVKDIFVEPQFDAKDKVQKKPIEKNVQEKDFQEEGVEYVQDKDFQEIKVMDRGYEVKDKAQLELINRKEDEVRGKWDDVLEEPNFNAQILDKSYKLKDQSAKFSSEARDKAQFSSDSSYKAQFSSEARDKAKFSSEARRAPEKLSEGKFEEKRDDMGKEPIKGTIMDKGQEVKQRKGRKEDKDRIIEGKENAEEKLVEGKDKFQLEYDDLCELNEEDPEKKLSNKDRKEQVDDRKEQLEEMQQQVEKTDQDNIIKTRERLRERRGKEEAQDFKEIPRDNKEKLGKDVKKQDDGKKLKGGQEESNQDQSKNTFREIREMHEDTRFMEDTDLDHKDETFDKSHEEGQKDKQEKNLVDETYFETKKVSNTDQFRMTGEQLTKQNEQDKDDSESKVKQLEGQRESFQAKEDFKPKPEVESKDNKSNLWKN